MSGLDLAVLVVLLWLGWQGYNRGLVGALVWLLLLIFTPVIAGAVATPLATLLGTLVPQIPDFMRQPVAVILALTVAGIGLSVVSGVVGVIVARLLQPLPIVLAANRAGGTFLATLAGVVGLGMGTLLVAGFLPSDQREQLDQTVWGSMVTPRLAQYTPFVRALLPIPDLSSPCNLPPEVIGSFLAQASPDLSGKAAQMLMSTIAADPSAFTAAGLSESEIAAAMPFFQAAAIGAVTTMPSADATTAAANVIKSALGCPNADGTPGTPMLSGDTADAARLFMEAAIAGQMP